MSRVGAPWLVLVGAAVSLASCAFGDVTLKEPPRASVATGSRRGEGREIVLLRPFANLRAQARCGMKKNGYNMDTASVLCPAQPELMLADLLGAELVAAGFKILPDLRQAGPSTIVLEGGVEQAFLEPKLNFFFAAFETDIALHVTARTASGLLAQRRFYVKGEEATYFASEDDMQRSFESASRQLVTSVVGAVANLADRFPAEPVRAAPVEAPPAGGAAAAADGGAAAEGGVP
jgi:hypothetical protein